MKYAMLIHHGTTPRPGQPNWDDLSQEEQRDIYQAYQELNRMPGVTPGNGMEEADKAIAIAAKVPSAALGGGIEIRPVKEW